MHFAEPADTIPVMVTVVAEIGTGHNGDLERGRRLIDMAARCGANFAKFQYVLAEEIVHPNTGAVPLPGGSIPLYERFKSLEQPQEFYAAMREHCRAAGIGFLCTPFGVGSARALRELAVSRLKIASPELNHIELLSEVAEYGLPLYVSTGVSKLADIETALDLLRGADVTLLHCVTAYPAPETDYNLRVLPTMSRIFGVPVGVSDHSDHPFLVGALGVSMGATVVEKHVTLSRDDLGLDDPIAQDEAGFAACVAEIRAVEAEEPEETRRRLARDFGDDLIEAVLGSGVKRLAPAEATSYQRTTRSLHALRELPAGHILEKGDFAALRTEKILRPGLHPKFADELLGAALTRLVPAGEGIRWADLINRPATDFASTVST